MSRPLPHLPTAPSSSRFSRLGSFLALLYLYIPFLLFVEVVLPMLPLWLGGRRDRAFWFVFLALLALPFFKIGPSVDICMRVSIPFLFVVMVWTMDVLLAARRPGDRLPRALLLAVLALGAFTPLHEISRTVINARRHPDAAAYYAGGEHGARPDFRIPSRRRERPRRVHQPIPRFVLPARPGAKARQLQEGPFKREVKELRELYAVSSG